MSRRTPAFAARIPTTESRTPGHLVARRSFRPTPELLAALAVLFLASVNAIGPLGVLLFFAGSAAVIAYRPLFNVRELLRFSALLLLPLLAIVSTIWSDAPQRSMRLGLELFATCAAAIVICRNLPPERFVLALFAAFLVMDLTVAPAIPQALATGQPLVAWLGSKNQVGLVGYMLLAMSLAVAVDRKQPWSARLAAVAAMPLSLLTMYLSQSGGSTSSVALTLLIFPPLALLAALKPPLRIAVSVLAVVMLIAAAFFLDDIEAWIADFRQNVLKKDATLTGRTYLWDFADRLSAARPTWGYGYGAFWRHGNIDAEGLWRWGGIASRSGFNFHNAFVGMRVDLGLVGMVLLIATCIGIALVGLARQVARPSVALAGLLGVTAVNYFRSFVEEGLVAPFSLITVVWFACALYAFPQAAPADAPAPAPAPRRTPLPRRVDAPMGRRPRPARQAPARAAY